MITFDQITKLFAFDTKQNSCVEIQFILIDSDKYDYCWMGKMWYEKEMRDVYWYGLTPDGKDAYDYPNFEEMADAPVFDGKNLKQIWDRVVIKEIDGLNPESRLLHYINSNH